MTNLPRKHQKIFAENAGNDLVQIGSTAKYGMGSEVKSSDPDIIQGLDDYFGIGWRNISILQNSKACPTLQDFNSLSYLVTRQLAYLFQKGIPEWNDSVTYYANNFSQIDGILYISLVDNNINYEPASNPTKWQVYLDNQNVARINISNNFTANQTITGNLNVTSMIKKNGVDINAAGTLTNVAYQNQSNTFLSAQNFNYLVGTGKLSTSGSGFVAAKEVLFDKNAGVYNLFSVSGFSALLVAISMQWATFYGSARLYSILYNPGTNTSTITSLGNTYYDTGAGYDCYLTADGSIIKANLNHGTDSGRGVSVAVMGVFGDNNFTWLQ